MSVAVAAPRRRGLRGPLVLHDFRWLAIGLMMSCLGAFAYHVALYALVYEATRSAGWAAATTMGRFVPSLVFSSYGGVLAERFERRRVLVVSDVMSTIVMLTLTLVAGVGLSVVFVIALASMISMLGTLYLPASAALLPQIVEEEELASANAFLSMIENVTTIVGPAIGVAAIALLGGRAAFLFCAACFSISAFCSSRLQVRSTPTDVTDGGEAGVLRQVAMGFRAIGSSRTAFVLVAAAVGAAFFYGVDTVLFVVVSEERLGLGPDGYGVLMVGLGLGSIAIAPLVGRFAARPKLATIIGVALVLYTVPTAALAVISEPAAAVALQVVRGAGAIVVDVLALTAIQRSLPAEMTARVLGVFNTLVLASISLGAFVTPLLLTAFGLEDALLVLGAGAGLLVLLAYGRIRAVDRETEARLAELAPTIERFQRLGIFADASRPGLERLAAVAESVEVAPGTVLIQQGDEADAFYLITSGEVEVTTSGYAGTRRVATLRAGQYFGEIGLIGHMPRTATVRALGPVTVQRVPGQDFVAALVESQASAAFMEGARMRLARSQPGLTLPEPGAV